MSVVFLNAKLPYSAVYQPKGMRRVSLLLPLMSCEFKLHLPEVFYVCFFHRDAGTGNARPQSSQ